MSTYAEMVTEIQDHFVNESITTAQVQKAIQRSIKKYQRKKFYFNHQLSTFSTVSGTEYYANGDDDDIEIISIIVSSGGLNCSVLPRVFTYIDERQDGTVTGLPTLYTNYQEKIRFYPIPAAAYTMTVAYWRKIAGPVADSDTNAWTEDAEELILQAAKVRLAINILHAPEMAEGPALLVQSALSDLVIETRNRMAQPLLQMPDELISNRHYNFYSDSYW